VSDVEDDLGHDDLDATSDEVDDVDEFGESDEVDEIDDGGDEAEPANQTLAPTATEVVRYLVRALVDDPDAVHVDAIERRRGVLLEVRVAQGELGRVIGRKGRTAQSLRTVARAAATRDDVTVDVDFVD
jgi:predicted RNA-binding protein YlqC (UPF0109 family)